MNKIILISIFLSISILSQAQDTQIEPSQQAKSYLESKNIAVDHATGIFSYKIPLHEIRAGDFKLPVTLDYVARGVKADAKPGAVGYNWNLNAGGVIMRTVRGGIADEAKMKGIINYLLPEDTVFWEKYSINNRYVDGETDIFTAVFCGKTVNFFIRYSDSTKSMLEAVPFEPTNIKIECDYGASEFLLGWTIIDEEGNTYYFSINETSTTTREGTVETNCIKDMHYISAWYLSHIKTFDGYHINFDYDADILTEKTFSRTAIKYSYEKPIIDHPYDFTKYKPEFEHEIQTARKYFSMDSYAKRLQQSALYNSLGDFYMNASLGEIWPERIIQNNKTMGVLYNLTYVNEAYQEIIGILDEIIEQCNRQTSTFYTRQAITHLNAAKNIVIECREEVNKTYLKTVYLYSWQEIRSPLLRSIRYTGGSIDFDYHKHNSEFLLLDEIIIRGINHDTLKSIRLNESAVTYDRFNRPLLNEISFHDKTGLKVSNIRMSYYDLVDELFVINIYGYYARYIGDYQSTFHDTDYIQKHRYNKNNDDNAFCSSLKKIKIANDAEIELSYGANYCNQNLLIDGHGGIRISKVEIKDLLSGKKDCISYSYSIGCYVNPASDNGLVVRYEAGFNDGLLFDRIINIGPDAYIKLGNNGIYYPRVTESFEGKGSIDYYFIVPGQQDSVYKYWNIGKPLGICYFNSEHALQKVVRYEYDEQLALTNQQFLKQIKACEYACNVGELLTEYGENADFLTNMGERLHPILPANQGYRISYGYDTYLKRISEYDFDEYTPTGKKLRYLEESPAYKITDYEYNFPKSTFPCKTTVTCSDGLKYTEIVKRALDFDDSVDSVIPLLKQKNMVGLPLKVQLKVVDCDGVETLLSEQVNKYENISTQYEIPLLTGIYDYRYDGKATERIGNLFGFDQAEYESTFIAYGNKNGKYLPVSIEKQRQRWVYQYDFMTGNVVFETSFVPENSVVACDYRRFKSLYGTPAFELQNAPSLKYRLYVISHRAQPGEISLSVKSSGSVSAHRFIINANDWGPQAFDLDLTELSGIEEISLPDAWKNLVYIALVPVDAEFEARSYNADGSVFCQFDHTGQAQRYEYDAAGRLSRVFDREGNILKEINYHVVVQ